MQFHYYTLSCIDSSTLSRKREYSINIRLISYAEKHLFYYSESWDYLKISNEKKTVVPNNFFYLIGVDISPALLLINKNKVLVIKYKNLFEPDMMTLSEKVIATINGFYNK